MDLENKKRFITDIVIKLRSDNSEVQSEAAEALNNQSDSLSAIELLLPYIHDQSKTVRQVIAQVLGEGGYSEVISSLLILTKDEDPYVRATAIYALSNFKENKLELVKTIEEKLKDTSSYVRSRAALCLGLLDVKRATTSLLEALKDSNGEVRGCAADALGRIGAKKAVAPIITLLNDPVVSTRKLAIIALSNQWCYLYTE